jgi:Ca2+-binding RTX toxin-like protein
MISVKGTRTPNGDTAGLDRHELKEDLAAYRIPAIVAIMLASLMLYLRSFMPVRADVAGSGPEKARLDSAENDGAGPADDQITVADGTGDGEGQQGHHVNAIDTGTDVGASSFRSRGYSAQDANVLKPHEFAAVRASSLPANTNDPDQVRDTIKLPPMTFSAAGGSASTGGSAGSGSGTGSGGGPGTDDDDDDDMPPVDRNRAPRNSGPVYLADVATTATLAIALSDLLANSTDRDGDTLSIRNLRSSSGTLTEQPGGGWIFTPSITNLGRVVFSFDVFDGTAYVPQFAYSMVTLGSGGPGGDDTGPGGGDDDDDGTDHGGDDCTPPESFVGYHPVIGGAGDDVLIGTDGNDWMSGGAGHDVAFGGAGNDWMSGGAGRDQLSGGTGDDQIYGGADEDVLDGGDGDDLLDGGEASDVLLAGAGDDALFGADGDDVLAGGDGNDQMSGGAGIDHLSGDAGHDIMFGNDGADLMLGGDGRDVLDGGAGADALYGGADADVLAGDAGDDVLSGDQGDDLLRGDDGHDRLFGALGADALFGGTGDDTIDGGEDGDQARDGEGADLVWLGAGDDWLAAAIDLGSDAFDGGEGLDTLDYSAATDSVTFDLAAATVTMGDNGADVIAGFEAFIGGDGDDHFIACDTPAIMTGGEGDDRFEFTAPENPVAIAATMFQILDFNVGDTVSVSRFDFFKDLAEDLDDQMESYFSESGNSGPGSDDPRIRFRHDQDNEQENTWIEIDFDRDDFFETTITMQGRHLFVMVENA